MQDTSQIVAKEYLEQVMRETGLSGAAVARAAGIAPSTINRVLNDPDVKHTLSLRTMMKIEKATGIAIPDSIIKLRQSTVRANNKIPVASARNSQDISSAFYPIGSVRDLPLAGSIDSVTGDLSIRTTVGAILVERPAALIGRQGYCVPMNDGSMYPVYSEGFPLYVDEDRAPVSGDDVVIRFKDGRALVRRFVERTPKAIICHQFAPDGDVTFAVDTILKLDVVVASGRLRM